MATSAERMVQDLEAMLTEIDNLAKAVLAEAGNGKQAEVSGLHATLANTRAKATELKDALVHSVQTADRKVHENAWTSIGTAAFVAFLAGMLIGSRR
jgi:ElaB/YqjD/DUF883 family membrane-anchored ribosome-binding protein